MKSKLIGVDGQLSSDQVQIVEILKETLAQALEGKITTIGVIVCFEDGFASVMGGRSAGALNMGCDEMKAKILDMVTRAGSEKVKNAAVSNIIKPRH